MNEFIDIARNKNRLRAACKDLSVEQMQTMVDHLGGFIAKRKEEEAAAQAAMAEQAAKKQEILDAMRAAGLSLDDFADAEAKQARQPVAAQYRITDAHGDSHEWSGRGRTPRAFQAYFDQGGSKDSCRI
ncbi:MAG: H-NS family nucleoid-associated regulatory protein [Gammaproteobacteria bacterium]|jgi:DNA-binding protein H-NS|nr:H-NS family nucleoid-associated regulatory protein [Gammaproteobacteria bacterium]